MPPQLVAETLMTLQHILFPMSDEKSDSMLVEMANKYADIFDGDCLNRDEYTRIAATVKPLYWSERLARLQEAAQQPQPRSRLMVWIDEHTSERNALYVAILGLFLSVLFGLLGVIIGIVQTVISYRAWKQPMQQSS